MTCAEYKKRMIVTGIVVTFFIAGCGGGLGNRGKVVAQPLGGKKETIEKLIEDYTKYDVYYSGIQPTVVATVLFCPKEGNFKITPDKWWVKVKDQAELKTIVRWMNTITYYHKTLPTVQLVLGPNSRLFGYVYSYNFPIETRVLSETDLMVYAPIN